MLSNKVRLVSCNEAREF